METLELIKKVFPKYHVEVITKYSRNIEYLVIGSPRSGTGYMSSVLTQAQIPCGHENIYGIGRHIKKPNTLRAESSWLATYFVDYVRNENPEVKIIHVVRDPALTLRSLLGINFYKGGHSNIRRYREFAFAVDESVKENIQQFIINWNQEAARVADYTHYLYESDKKLFYDLDIDVENPKNISKKTNRSGRPFNKDISEYTEILELSKMYNNKENIYGKD